MHLTSRAGALKPARSREARVKPSLALLSIVIVLSLGVAGCGASGPQRSVSSVPRQAGASVRLVYRAQGETEPVASRSLTAAIAIMRRRVEALGVSSAIIRRVGMDDIEVALPAGSPAAAQEAVSKTGQLYFYAWEPNVIGAGGRPAPSDRAATGDEAVEGPGGRSESPGCTPRQVGGCLYGSWYLLDLAHEHVLQGPLDTKTDLYARGYEPPAGAKPRAVHVNPGTVLVRARAVEGKKSGTIVNASPNSWYVLNDDPVLTGADLVHPAQGKEEFTGWPDITFGFTPHGAAVFERVTKEIAYRGLEAQLPGVTKEEAEQHFAVVLDGQLLTGPSIDYVAFPEGIDASKGSEISGGFTRSSAQALTSELKSGPLPIGLELIPRGLG